MTADFASCLASILQAGRVEQEQHAQLHLLLDGLVYCSVGVYIKEYEAVITTDNLLAVGFADLSICPVKLSVVGSVISRGVGYHSNIPADRHRTIALKAAEAIAYDFVEATSSMYNNITDYVLGPMHGHDVPTSPAERPIPPPPQAPAEGCWDSSDSDDNDDDEGPSAMVSCSPDRSSVSVKAIAEPLPAVHSRLLDASSSAGSHTAGLFPFQSVSRQPAQHQAAAASLPNSDVHSSEPLLKHHSSPEQLLGPSRRAAPSKAEPASVGQHPQSQSPPVKLSEVSQPGRQSQHQHQSQSPDSEQDSNSKPADTGSSPHHSLFARPLDLKEAARVASALRSTFSRDHSPARRRSLQRVSSAKQKQSEILLDGMHPQHNPDTASKFANGKLAGKVKGKLVDPDAVDTKPVDYSQHRFILIFRDPKIEREYCLWHAKHRTKVQLCYALAIISVAMCMVYMTPSADRNPLLWWPPLLQLVPVCAMACNRAWYCRHSEVLHVGLNVLKTIWAVSVGVPCQGEFWNSKRRLAVVWKFSMDNLVISGLGDLARFTIFMPVQALDLAIVTASSGVLCKQPSSSQIPPWQCVVITLVSHVLVAYFAIGSLVWYMDKQARKSFVMQRELDQLTRAARIPPASLVLLPSAVSGLNSLD